MAQIYVNNTLIKPKAIHVYSTNWLMKKVGYVYQNGVWNPFIRYELFLYSEGVEFVPFQTASYGSANLQKTSDYFHVYKPAGAEAWREGFITTNMLNLTNYTQLKIEWSSENSATTVSYSFGVKKDNALNGQFIAYSRVQNLTAKRIDILDISNLTGDYYVDAYLSDSGVYTTGSLYIYKIWLE
jgi:hypothetical protein